MSQAKIAIKIEDLSFKYLSSSRLDEGKAVLKPGT